MDRYRWLPGLDGSFPRSVGISPTYYTSGGLTALACALDTRVLVINLHGKKSYRDSSAADSVERRKLLEEELLCHPLYTLRI